MDKVDLVIENGTLVKSEGILSASIAIDKGKIHSIGKSSQMPKAEEKIDASKKLVMPGAVDAHVHLYLPEMISETFETGTRGAIYGGVTTVIEMPSLGEFITTYVENFEEKLKMGERESYCDFSLHAGEIQKMEHTEQIEELVKSGARGFKITMGGGNSAAENDGVIMEAFQKIADTGSIAMVHAENQELYKYYQEKIRSSEEITASSYPQGRPKIVEEEAISRAILFSREAGNHLHVCHLTTEGGLKMIETAKNRGQNITSEVTPHHLLLNKNHYKEYGNRAIMNPPLRDPRDNQYLWSGLRKGTIDCVVTDHCAYTKEEKDSALKEDILDTPPGIPGLESVMRLMVNESLENDRISLSRIAKVCSENPARIYGLYPEKGSLKEGTDADIIIFDKNKETTFSEDQLKCVGEVTPFDGWKLKGDLERVIIRGKTVMEDNKIVEKPSFGQFVPER